MKPFSALKEIRPSRHCGQTNVGNVIQAKLAEGTGKGLLFFQLME